MNQLLNEQWKIVEHLFPRQENRNPWGHPPSDVRAVLDAILWVERTGGRWVDLPPEFPPRGTCYIKFLQWRRLGILRQIHDLLDAAGAPVQSRETETCADSCHADCAL